MAKGPVEAANILVRQLSVESPPRKVRDVLVEIITVAAWYSGADAEDQADLWLVRFTARLTHIADQSRERGEFVNFTFNSSGSEHIQGYCFCEPGDSVDVRAAKTKRAQTQNILLSIAAISANDFEHLSGRVLSLLGVTTPHVSKRSADQGIDFFGRVPLGEMLKPSLLDSGAEKHMSVWLVGQAKHYPETKVSTGEIRELVGSVEFARAKVFAGSSNPLSELTARLCDPIIYLFFTTGRFTRDSQALLTRSGVLSFDGLQLSQFLADHGIGISAGTFSKAEFDTWLALGT